MLKTKSRLIELLADPDTRVIALTGRWGSGKSHLWRDVKKDSRDEAITSALFVSLFGVRSIAETKLKLLNAAAKKDGEGTAWWGKVTTSAQNAQKVARHLYKGLDALGELVELSVPSLLKGRVIVLDDMERKHKDLSVDEVLGFVDEYCVQYGNRFVLIFNGDKLGSDIKVWEEMREKVVDHELELQTTPQEAVEIAMRIVPTPFAAAIAEATTACGITNIRILQKVIRATNRILLATRAGPAGARASGASGSVPVAAPVVRRTVPSIVLLAGIHYKGIDDPPDFDFIQQFGSPTASAEGTDIGEQARRERWAGLMRGIGFSGADEFEPLVRRYLDTGTYGDSDIEGILARYVANHERATLIARAEELKFRIGWDASAQDAELLGAARALRPDIRHLAPGQLNALFEQVRSLPGGGDTAESLVDTWVLQFDHQQAAGDDLDAFYAPVKGYHPKIVQACDQARLALSPRHTIFSAVERIARTGNWGGEQAFLNRCTVADFREALASMLAADRKLVVGKLLDMGLRRAAYAGFGPAIDAFLQACAGIAADPGSGRLGHILGSRLKLFEARGGRG